MSIAAVIWILIGAGWLCFIAPKLLKAQEAGEFERQHEEMKQRIQVG